MRKFSQFYLTIFLLIVSAISASSYAPQYLEEKNNLKLRWKPGTIPISISSSLTRANPNIEAESDVLGAIRRSLQSWEKVSNVDFEEIASDKQTVSPTGNFGDGVSLITIAQTPENFLMFGEDAEEASAITRVFFNKKGVITEADIVLNPYQRFSTDGSVGTFDLESTLTHEIGHLLGLEHSFVMGATMHAHQGKNGVYNLANFSSRTLAEDDITAVRSLYGTNAGDEGCCGAINGKLFLVNGKAARNYQVWAEEVSVGKIAAGVLTETDGSFRIEGLRNGNYRIYAQRAPDDAEKSFSIENLGEVEIKKEKEIAITKKLQQNPKAIDLRYVGFNGQISELPVSLNGGKSYVVYIGGKNFDASRLNISFKSPHISVARDSFIKYDYEFDISVVSFEVLIKNNAPLGEYGIYVENGDGRTYCLNGGVTIENFENGWSTNLLSENS